MEDCLKSIIFTFKYTHVFKHKKLAFLAGEKTKIYC